MNPTADDVLRDVMNFVDAFAAARFDATFVDEQLGIMKLLIAQVISRMESEKAVTASAAEAYAEMRGRLPIDPGPSAGADRVNDEASREAMHAILALEDEDFEAHVSDIMASLQHVYSMEIEMLGRGYAAGT